MANIVDKNSAYLVENAGQTSDFTDAEILAELKLRIVPDDDDNEGGIHPHRPL